MNMQAITKILRFMAVLSLMFTPSVASAWVDPEIRDFTIDCEVDDNVQANLYSVTYYKLTNVSTGDIIVEWEDRNQPEHDELPISFNLEDGDYRLYVENYDGDSIPPKNFTVDCDKPEPELEIKHLCVGTSANSGELEVTAPNGLDWYELFRTDTTPNTLISSSTNVTAGDINDPKFKNLSDGNYSFTGTLGTNFETDTTIEFDCYEEPALEPISCPFDSSDGTVINFSEKNRVRADLGENASRTNVESVNLPAGTYRVQLFGYDQHENRSSQTQPRETFFLSLLNNGVEITQTPEFVGSSNLGDLEDGVNSAQDTFVVNNFAVPEDIDAVVGISAPYTDGETDNANSIDLCAAFELIEEEPQDDFTGQCVVSPRNVETGEDVTWSASASGGDGTYTYSWDLEGSNDDDDTREITTSYNNEGTFNGTVEISDGDLVIQRTCSIRVEDEDDNGGGGGGDRLDPRDPDDDGEVRGDRDVFGVQCLPEKSAYLVGEVVTFNATVDGDIDEDDADFSWSGHSSLDEDDERATAQYTTTGIKEVEVEAEYDGDVERDTCFVQIAGAGVTLDQVPYTGPGDTAKTLGFIMTLVLLSGIGAHTMIRRREDSIPVGIPNKSN
ncbi:MAG: PKD domain-containing protein [Candidatus Paceibacterota bacterium]